MRYFDFHAHAFADSIAERAVSGLADTSSIKPATDGTVKGLRKLMQEKGISEAMLLPIATKPSQQTTINNWAAEIMGDGIYCCGTVHPDAEDAVSETERIKSLGLYGLKFHSEYQFFRPDDEKMFPIYRKAQELGLMVVFHGGWDPYGKGEILASPESFAAIAEKFPDLTIVAAHLGGMRLFDRVEDCLAGRFENLYFDTGVIARYIGEFTDDEQVFRIIKKQGAEKILFGSDCPWDSPENEIAMINRIPLTENEKEQIFFRNAENLLINSRNIK